MTSGGFTAGRGDVIAMLRQRSRPYLFSNTVAPALVASASAALDLLVENEEEKNEYGDEDGYDKEEKEEEEEEDRSRMRTATTTTTAPGAALRARLYENTASFRARMTAAGFRLGGGVRGKGVRGLFTTPPHLRAVTRLFF